MISLSVLACLVGACLATFKSAQASSKSVALAKYNISSVTVSGVSSGAYMAVQMHISYSMVISGMAAFAGVSYGDFNLQHKCHF